jgi:hypothetical protein
MLYRLAIVAAILLLLAAVARAGVTTTADGWTDISPSADSRVLYVAASGLDTNPGTQAAPLKTIAAAVGKTRAGYPDWVLLKRGDTFREAINWGTGGRSADEPQLLGVWGVGARPIVSPPSGGNGFEASYNRRAFLAVVGVAFVATRDPANVAPAGTGVRWYGPGDGLLIEDCYIEGFGNGINVIGADATAAISNVLLNRCVVVDCYRTASTHGEGIYCTYARNVTLRECVFDRNGWSPTAPNAGRDVYSHNIYIDNEQAGGPGPGVGFTVERCILTRGASHGLQLRCGGNVVDNLFAENSIALLVGGGDGFATSSPGGISFTASNNVILQSGDIDASNPRGYGVDLVNIKTGDFRGNIIAHDASAAAYGHGVSIDAPTTGLSLTGNIVWDWRTPRLVGAGVTVTETGNAWLARGAANPGFVDAGRTVGTYHASIGGAATLDAFLARARTQSRATWDARYTASAVNAHVRAGFALGTPTPPAPPATQPAPVPPTFDLTLSITATGGTFRAVDSSGKAIDGTVGKIDLTVRR